MTFQEHYRIKLTAFYVPQLILFLKTTSGAGKDSLSGQCIAHAPAFKVNYQPHLPAKLGFYDLREQRLWQKQAELAHE